MNKKHRVSRQRSFPCDTQLHIVNRQDALVHRLSEPYHHQQHSIVCEPPPLHFRPHPPTNHPALEFRSRRTSVACSNMRHYYRPTGREQAAGHLRCGCGLRKCFPVACLCDLRAPPVHHDPPRQSFVVTSGSQTAQGVGGEAHKNKLEESKLVLRTASCVSGGVGG